MQHPPPANKENAKFIVRWSHTIRRFLDLAVLPITMHCATALCCQHNEGGGCSALQYRQAREVTVHKLLLQKH